MSELRNIRTIEEEYGDLTDTVQNEFASMELDTEECNSAIDVLRHVESLDDCPEVLYESIKGIREALERAYNQHFGLDA